MPAWFGRRPLGSPYLVGDRLTAPDIHFAAFSGMIHPLPQEFNPMPQMLRDFYSSGEARLREAITPELIAHRDYIYPQPPQTAARLLSDVGELS